MTEVADLSPTDASNTAITGQSLEGNVANMANMDDTLQAMLGMLGRWTSSDTIASAATTDIGAQPEAYLTVSGTTTITAFGTVRAGTVRYLRFSGALTLTHNATSLILPGAANITTAAGDTAIVVSEGSGNWRCVSYQRAATIPYSSSSGTGTATLICGTSGTITLSDNSVRYVRTGNRVSFTGLLTVSSVSSPVGTLTVSGSLPVASGNASTAFYSAVNLRIAGFVASGIWQAFIPSGSSSIVIDYYSTAYGSITGSAANQIKAGTTIVVSGTYFTE